ncbi:MAG: DoxX family protein [Ktedonobacterales bacterium]
MTVSMHVALLVLRVIGGLTLAAHGSQKLFGWFDGPGPVKLRQGFAKQGFRPSWLWVSFVILGEFGGGLSLALGFLTPLGAAGGLGAMFMAIAKSHWKNGFWNSKRGYEFPLSLLAIAGAIGLAGPGTYSLDTLFGIALPTPALFLALAVAAIVVDVIGLTISRPAAAATVPPAAPAPATGTAPSDVTTRAS